MNGKLSARISFALVVLVACASPSLAAQSANEKAVWKLEHSYWEYVQAGDLNRYKALWHPDFVGWPASSPKPVHKDHITDWITNATKKGLHLKSYMLKPAASHATGDVVITHYWLTDLWVDKNGAGKPATDKLTHTWIRTPTGWQIIGGMAAPVTKEVE
jgi:ketosteroid isomerase-like protein